MEQFIRSVFNSMRNDWMLDVVYMSEISEILGNKILLPPSLLNTIMIRDVPSPYLFKLEANGHSLYCGCHAFTASEGCCGIPEWILNALGCSIGSNIKILLSQPLPPAQYVRFKEETEGLNELPRVVLEKALSNYFCLQLNLTIPIFFNNKTYFLTPTHITPSNAVSILNIDLPFEFEQKSDPKEEVTIPIESEKPSNPKPQNALNDYLFSGTGYSLKDDPLQSPISTPLKLLYGQRILSEEPTKKRSVASKFQTNKQTNLFSGEGYKLK